MGFLWNKPVTLEVVCLHYYYYTLFTDRLCGLVVTISGYRSRGSGFDFWCFQIFREAVGLERGPLSLVRTTEELLEGKVVAPV
jgi:hypothetical protein